MIAGVKLSCKNSIKFERAGVGKRKGWKMKYSPSNDSGVTGVVVSLVVKSSVRYRHPKGESKKTGFTESLGSTHLAAVLFTVSV